MPRTTIQRRRDDFFTALEADAVDRPTIVGELYFEYHRGTYTTQAAIKRGNREGERALHDAELLAAVAGRVAGRASRRAAGAAWQLLLLNQFHDILPGSSIGQVYERTRAEHAEVVSAAEAVSADALAPAARRRAGQRLRSTRWGSPGAGVADHPDGELVWVEAPACGFGAVAERSRPR